MLNSCMCINGIIAWYIVACIPSFNLYHTGRHFIKYFCEHSFLPLMIASIKFPHQNFFIMIIILSSLLEFVGPETKNGNRFYISVPMHHILEIPDRHTQSMKGHLFDFD